jgi:hypothetical protein
LPSSSIKFNSLKKDSKSGKIKGCRFEAQEKGTYLDKGTGRAFALFDVKGNWLFVHELDKRGNVELDNYQLGHNNSLGILSRLASYYKCKMRDDVDSDVLYSASDLRSAYG